MKSYNKKCPGCGIGFQYENDQQPGYAPTEESILCQKCFRSKNYGEYTNNLESFYELEEIKEIENNNVIMIIDVLNPFETLISDINKYVSKENLTILVNKIDCLPKAINHESIIDWIDELAYMKNIEFSNLALVSANKKSNIDAISSFITNSNFDTSIIGYSNVGKSSIIKALYNAIGKDVDNLVTNSIGTTKSIIELQYEDKIIKDYPGIILKGSYQNIMDIEELKETHPKKEIKVSNYQLNDQQTIEIGKYAKFNILEQEGKEGYQFTFSNLVELLRTKFKGNKEEFIEHEINHESNKRYDIIISGLGIITFKSKGQKLTLELPKDVVFNVVPSLYL